MTSVQHDLTTAIAHHRRRQSMSLCNHISVPEHTKRILSRRRYPQRASHAGGGITGNGFVSAISMIVLTHSR